MESSLPPLIKPYNRWFEHRFAAPLLLFVLALLFYYNAIPGGYVLDDGLVLNNNEFVKRGLDGIPDILTKDSFYGSIGSAANLNGGRYRPLELVTFAIEYELFGLNPVYSRIINVLLYALTGVLVYLFLLRFVFQHSNISAFIGALLFVIHPIHTEVVANIKSRDEILSFLLLLGTLFWLLAAAQGGFGLGRYTIALVHFAFALLAKENGLAFIAIIPLTLFVFTRKSLVQIFNYTLPFILVIVGYIALRVSLIGFQSGTVAELMDNPYLLANTEQKYATIAVVFLHYLKLLFWPHPLTYDYSYNQIPYVNFSSGFVWLSILLNGCLLLYALVELRNRNLFSWCILFYFLSLFMVSNLVINIGAPMGERFLYQAGFPLGIALVAAFSNIAVRSRWTYVTRMTIAWILLLPITVLAFYKTHDRNKAWLKGETLGLTDVKVSNNSARALTYAGINKLSLSDQTKDSVERRQLIRESIPYLQKAITIHPQFGMAWQNLGVAYYRLGDVAKAGDAWLNASHVNAGIGVKVGEYLKALSNQRFNEGLKAGTEKDFRTSITKFRQAVRYDSTNAEIWYNLGGAYFTIQKFDSARRAWTKALQYNPTHQGAQQGMNALPKNSNFIQTSMTSNNTYAIAIHGGAGTLSKTLMNDDVAKQYRDALDEALTAGETVLKNGGAALDAVTAAVVVLEDNPLFNAGRGSVYNSVGKHEMDASIMDGSKFQAGAVCGVSNIKNPIKAARTVMEKSEHVMMCGDGAEKFAKLNKIEFAPDKYFDTEFRHKQWQKVKDEDGAMLDHDVTVEDKKFGTVGCVALDKNGNLAAATSTGGMTNKKFGRVGDSPIIGAGTYANNFCAISCTGHGEFFMRAMAAYDVAALMMYKNETLENATSTVIHDKLKPVGGEGGLIAVDKDGNIAMPFNSEGMYRASANSQGRHEVLIY